MRRDVVRLGQIYLVPLDGLTHDQFGFDPLARARGLLVRLERAVLATASTHGLVAERRAPHIRERVDDVAESVFRVAADVRAAGRGVVVEDRVSAIRPHQIKVLGGASCDDLVATSKRVPSSAISVIVSCHLRKRLHSQFRHLDGYHSKSAGSTR